MPRLLIGAAHTLESPGEIFQDLREADLTRKILGKTLPYLDSLKIVYKAVPLDLPLIQRIQWINSTGFTAEQGDIFVEIHINDGGKTGVESWFKGSAAKENKSQRLAQSINDNLCKFMNFQSQGAKSEFDHELAGLMILSDTKTISTAVEILYIDNPEDIKVLRDDKKLDEIGKALADSVNEYFKEVALQPEPNNKVVESAKPKEPKLDPFADLMEDDMLDDFSFGPTAGANNFGTPAPKNNLFNNPMPPANTQQKPLLMDREQRKKMIIDVYTRILGREPTQKEQNDNLNLGVSEEDLTKKLLESEDFKKLQQEAKDAKTLRDNSLKTEAEKVELQARVKELEAILNHMQRVQDQLKGLIKKLQDELTANGIVPKGQHIDTFRNGKDPQKSLPAGQKSKKKKGFLEFVADLFKL